MCLLENIYFGTHSFDDIHIIELITLNSLLKSKTILMELKTFGARLNVICGNLMAFLNLIFLYF